MFRFKRSIPVSYDEQAYIYYKSKMFCRLGVQEQRKIRKLCEDAGAQYKNAVFDFVTTDQNATYVCSRHFISRSTLERAVRKYYIAAAKKLL